MTLWQFVKQVRLPAETMPPISSVLGGDAELASVYAWLEGANVVRTPSPVRVILEGPDRVPTGSEATFRFAAHLAETTEEETAPSDPAVQYRVTLVRRDDTPVADRALAYRLSEGAEWREVTTDGTGQVLLGPGDGVEELTVRGSERERPTSALRVAVATSDRYALLIEVLETDGTSSPRVLGIGSAVFDVE